MARREWVARGAGVVEYMVVLGALVLAVMAGFLAFGSAIEKATACLGSEVLGKADCGKPAVFAANPKDSVIDVSGGQASVPGDISCGPMGCKPGSGNCFAPGTLVSTEHGLRAIETITTGERVWSRDELSGENALRAVAATIVKPHQPLLAIGIHDARSFDTIRVTSEHPFFVRDRGWVGAAQLAPGDVLVGENGDASVESAMSTNETSDVHNLEVEGLHTYFVGRARALVHNQCSPAAKPVVDKLTPAPLNAAPLANAKNWDAMKNPVHALWKSMAQIDGHKITPSDPTATAYDYTQGGGWIRTDFYGIIVTLPPGTTPEGLLLEMQNDPHSATGNDKTFHSWVTWDKPPATRAAGNTVDLQIYGDAGPIQYISPVTGAKDGPQTFTVMTMTNKASGGHPVSGYRTWGISPVTGETVDDKHPQKYVVFTAGIDSPSIAGSGALGVGFQRDTWNAYMSGLAREIKHRGGGATDGVANRTVAQSNSLKPTDTSMIKGPDAFDWYAYPKKYDPLPKWEDPRYKPPPPTEQQRMDSEIRKYANSCTSDRRNCSGELGRYARELLANDERRRLEAAGLPVPPKDSDLLLELFNQPKKTGGTPTDRDRQKLIDFLKAPPPPPTK